MAYVSKARRKTPDLRKPLPGNGTSLIPGKPHKVTIGHTNMVDKVIVVVFKDNFGESHVERIFRINKNGDDLSGLLKQLIAATARDSSELKDLYDSFLNGDDYKVTSLIGTECIIETEYRDDFVNIKTIRSNNDRDNGGGFFQPIEADKSQPKGTADTGKSKRYLGLSDEASSFF